MNVAIIEASLQQDDGTERRDISYYAAAFSEHSESIVTNIDTQVKLLLLKEFLIPFSVNFTEYQNSYVCSPYTALIPYAVEEVDKIDNFLLRALIKCLLPIFSIYFKKNRINSIVSINNWMLSTNLYETKWTGNELEKITSLFVSRYPKHTLMFRSLNEHSNKNLIDIFKKKDYVLVPSRQVYIFDQSLKEFDESHNYKIDTKLLTTTSLQYVSAKQIGKRDFKRIVALYNMLYIEKYSQHNPKFSEQFIELISNNSLFFLYGFRNKNGVLDAVGVRFTRDRITTLPIVGYDTNKPKSDGLYRLVLMSTITWAYENKMVFNASSGASHYKMLRGACPYIEYSAIYIQHLPKSVQRMWRGIAYILQQYIVPIMKKYQL